MSDRNKKKRKEETKNTEESSESLYVTSQVSLPAEDKSTSTPFPKNINSNNGSVEEFVSALDVLSDPTSEAQKTTFVEPLPRKDSEKLSVDFTIEEVPKAEELTSQIESAMSVPDLKSPPIAKVSEPQASSKSQLDVEKKPEESPRKSQHRSSISIGFSRKLSMGRAFVYMILPPDGGYGWLITFISFVTQIIIDGIIFSIGIVLPSMAKEFQVEMTQAIFISALQISFYFLSGPITSAFINRFGFRRVAMSGAAGAAMCLLIASFSPNLEMMIVFYSVLGGTLMSMTWVSSQLIIGYYFEKYRPIANGLSCSGSGVGLFVFVELNTQLVPRIGWRNNTRIHVGLLCIACLLSYSFAEVSPTKVGIIHTKGDIHEVTEDEDEHVDEHEVHTFNYLDPESVQAEDRNVVLMELESTESRTLKVYERDVPGCCREYCQTHSTCMRKKTKKFESDEDLTVTRRFVLQKDLIEKQDLYYTGPAVYPETDADTKHEVIDGQDVELIEAQKRAEAVRYSISMFSTPKTEKERDGHRLKGKSKFLRLVNVVPKKIRKSFRILFNFTLFRTMEFRILFLSASLYAFAVNIPFLFSKERLKLPLQQSSLIPTFIGVTNFLFRVLCGFLAYKLKNMLVYLCGSSIVLGGITVTVSAFYGQSNFIFQIIYAVLFGIAPAFFSTLRAIIYVQYLGLGNLTNAFGLVAMGMGVAVFLGTVIAGFLNVWTSSFTPSFALSGGCLIISGVLKLMLPYISKRRSDRSRKVTFSF